MYMLFSQYEYDLYSIASLIVSANRLAMSSVFSQMVVTRHNCVFSKQPIKSLN